MRRVYQAVGLVFIAIGLFVVREARSLVISTELGPGGGFFPFWLGLLFTGFSVIWFLQVTLQPSEPMAKDFVPDWLGAVRILSIVLALALFTWFVNTLGYQLAMFLFLLFLVFALGRQSVLVTVPVCLGGSFGVYYVFNTWLHVHLPVSSIEFLQALGL